MDKTEQVRELIQTGVALEEKLSLIRQQVLKEVGAWLDVELTPCGFTTKSLEDGIAKLKQGQMPEEK